MVSLTGKHCDELVGLQRLYDLLRRSVAQAKPLRPIVVGVIFGARWNKQPVTLIHTHAKIKENDFPVMPEFR